MHHVHLLNRVIVLRQVSGGYAATRADSKWARVLVCCAVCHVFHSASLFVDDALDMKHGQAPLDKQESERAPRAEGHEFVDYQLLIMTLALLANGTCAYIALLYSRQVAADST